MLLLCAAGYSLLNLSTGDPLENYALPAVIVVMALSFFREVYRTRPSVVRDLGTGP